MGIRESDVSRYPDYSTTLIDELLARTRLPWLWVIIGVGLILFLLLGISAYLDGLFFQAFDRNFWRGSLQGPAIILYILIIHHLLKRPGEGAIEAYRSLLAMDDDSFEQLMAEAASPSRGREWLALGLGAVAGLLLTRPWTAPAQFVWMKLYWHVTIALMFGLLGWIVYGSLASSRLFRQFHRQPIEIDIFDPAPLEPVARLSLAISFAFMGGMTLSVLFYPSLQYLLVIENIIIYGVLILVTILVFFLTLMNAHQAMAEAKERELRTVRQNLSTTYQTLKEKVAKDQLEAMEAVSDSISAWLAYEKRIEAAPEWPYTADTLRNLLLSTLLPGVAWIFQVVVEIIA
jgi:hypothetical protein